jgi:hypothetical protein
MFTYQRETRAPAALSRINVESCAPFNRWVSPVLEQGNSVREMVSIFLWFGKVREVAVKVPYKSVKQLLSCWFWSIPSRVTLRLFRALRKKDTSFCTVLSVFLTSSPKRASRTADWISWFSVWSYSFMLRSSRVRFSARNPTNLTEI